MWKRKKSQTERHIPLTPTEYPAGIVVRTFMASYLINKDGKRYKIPTNRILESWNFPLIVDTSEEALRKYPVAVTKLGFRDGSLLNNIADGKLYLVSGSKLRHVTSPEILDRLGVTRDDALVVSDAEIKIMKFGEELN